MWSRRNRETWEEEKPTQVTTKRNEGSCEVGEKEEIMNLRREIEHARIVEDHLIGQTKEMENENKYLREELDRAHEKLAIKEKFENSSTSLEGILNSQRSPYDSFGLVHNSGEKVVNKDATLEDYKERGKY